jgi:hypothetical protein
MNITETTNALALAQAFDNRTVGEVNIRAWHSVLSEEDATDVMTAIRDHYTGTTEWIMPAHILKGVREMAARRERAEQATGWAPGQAGVPKGEAMPEISGPIDESTITPSVRALLEATRAMLPEGSRETLMPRRVAWEREHASFVRTRDAEPNPHYRPRSADADTGILPGAHRCADCSFTTADPSRMDDHLVATGHVHE